MISNIARRDGCPATDHKVTQQGGGPRSILVSGKGLRSRIAGGDNGPFGTPKLLQGSVEVRMAAGQAEGIALPVQRHTILGRKKSGLIGITR